jgi:hypothetical protein
MHAYADKVLRRMRAYVHAVWRLNRRFDVWTISLPLWRFALGYYAVLLLATYVISWTSGRSPQFSWPGGRRPGTSRSQRSSRRAVCSADASGDVGWV